MSRVAAPSPGAVTTSNVTLWSRSSSKQGDEVPQSPRHPVEATDDESLDAAGPNHLQQSLKRRSVEGRARESLVVESFFDRYVAQRAQRLNISPAQVELDLAG